MMKKVQEFIREQHMIATGDRVIAGVSGGADSVCLLFQLLEYQKKCEFSLEVVHIEHGIRGGESLEDAAFVEELCQKHGILFHLRRFDVLSIARERKLSVEEAGRQVRYAAFAELLQERGANKIAVAHNRDDQAETILMNLARGSGLKGLGGMLPVRGQVIRPLLGTGRAQIEEYLRERGIAWRVDTTNLEPDYARNRTRLLVLPALSQAVNERAAEHIAQAGFRLQRIQTYLEHEEKKLEERLVKSSGKDSVKIVRDDFLMQERLMQEYLIQRCLERIGGLKDVGEVHIEALCRLASLENGKEVKLPGRLRGKNKNEFLVLERENEGRKEELEGAEICIPGVTCWGDFRIVTSLEAPENQIIAEKKYTKWFDYDTIKNKLQIRTRKSGDYLTVNAQGGRKTLKKYFIDEKILQEERDFIPLLADGSHILWAVGYRISEAYKVKGHTRCILKIHLERIRKG